MSEGVIFGVGAVIFAITVYGSVMAGGLALARVEAKEQAAQEDRVEFPNLPPEGPPDTQQ